MGGYVGGFQFGAELVGLLGVAGLGFLEAWWSHPRPPVQRGRIHGTHSDTSRCPYCHEDLAAEGDEPALATMSCSTCKVVHHSVCWAGHGGCSVYGCGPARRVPTTPREPLPASPVPLPATPAG